VTKPIKYSKNYYSKLKNNLFKCESILTGLVFVRVWVKLPRGQAYLRGISLLIAS
jgi:hypothetical protein